MVEEVTRAEVLACLGAIARTMAEQKDHLSQLDADIGDGDHGINMDRGFTAVQAKLGGLSHAEADIGALLKATGTTLISTVGGASGPLYGTLFLRMGVAAAGKDRLSGGDVLALLEAGVKGVQERGKAAPGDKTMLDALAPALEALREAIAQGEGAASAVRRAASAARAGAEATIPLQARKGRASYLGERSVGHEDPGAVSAHLLLQAMADTLTAGKE
jgi:dihydroxyacetone kinase-like protein